jgi:hypothetical protein
MRFAFWFLILFFSNTSFGQKTDSKITREEYIEKYSVWAVKGMLESGVPASITLSQGMLESDNGNSPLAVKANNHFGIKCHSEWTGKTFHQDDDAKHECFRKYKSVYESFKDHSEFLRKYKRYEFLFSLDVTDFKGWAEGLKKAGYATNPKYPQLLIKIIEDNNLQRFDTIKESDIKDNNNDLIVDNNETPDDKNPKNNSNSTDDIVINANARETKINNRIKYVIAKEGDSFEKIANEMDLMSWQLYKYNDFEKGKKPKKGQIVYLQPKRGKADFGNEYHEVVKGENMYDISQKYGIKLNKLYSRNLMKPGSQPKIGEKLNLRKNKRL